MNKEYCCLRLGDYKIWYILQEKACIFIVILEDMMTSYYKSLKVPL